MTCHVIPPCHSTYVWSPNPPLIPVSVEFRDTAGKDLYLVLYLCMISMFLTTLDKLSAILYTEQDLTIPKDKSVNSPRNRRTFREKASEFVPTLVPRARKKLMLSTDSRLYIG